MKNKFIKVLGALVCLITIGILVAEDTTSRYTTGTTSGTILFDRLADDGWTVTEVDAQSDSTTARVYFFGRLVSTAYAKVTTASTNGQTVIAMTPTTGIATNDLVYFKPSGSTPGVVATAGTITSSNITFATGPQTALAVGDIACEINKIHGFLTVSNATTVGSWARTGNGIVKTQGNSPLYITITGTATNELSVTATKDPR